MREDYIKFISGWYADNLPHTSSDNIETDSTTRANTILHHLNFQLDSWVIQKRSEHRNPRVEMLTIAEREEFASDLLTETIDDEGKPVMLYLDSLLTILRERIPNMPQEFGISAVALLGGNCARVDSNAAAAASVWKWSNRTAMEGWGPEDVAPLRVIQCFGKTVSIRTRETEDGLLKLLDDFKMVTNESRSQLEIAGGFQEAEEHILDLHQWLLIQMTEILALMPATSLRKQLKDYNGSPSLGKAWLDQVLPWFPFDHGRALFHQHHGRILLALGKLPEARKEIELALEHAKPHMLQSIETSRHMQLALDLEDISRIATGRVEEKAKGGIEKLSEDLQIELRSQGEDLRKELQEGAEAARNETNEEIKSALLRVIEILGIFLGIVSIAVTSVGGIAAGRDALQTFIIFGVGYASIVLLVVVLRWIVHKEPPIRINRIAKEPMDSPAQQIHKHSRDTGNANHGDNEQKVNAPEQKDKSRRTATSGQQGKGEMDGAAA